VSPARLEAHLRTRYGTTAPTTYNRNLATIGSLFAWVVEAGALAASPAAGLRRRKQCRSRPQELQANAIAQDELQALWRDSRRRLRDRTLWALASATAARAEELLQLDVEHLDLANRQAQIIGKGGSAGAGIQLNDTDRINWLRRRYHVVESLLEVRGRLAVGPTKTFETQWVPMPVFVADALREHVEAYPSEDRLVFTSTEGTPLRHRNFMRRHFKPAVVRAGLPEQLRFHDLRHTAAALLIAEGATMEEVEQILGHSTIRVTSDTYGHLFDDHADPLMEALAARRVTAGVPKACPSPVVDLSQTRISAGRNRR
jgi:integrase